MIFTLTLPALFSLDIEVSLTSNALDACEEWGTVGTG